MRILFPLAFRDQEGAQRPWIFLPQDGVEPLAKRLIASPVVAHVRASLTGGTMPAWHRTCTARVLPSSVPPSRVPPSHLGRDHCYPQATPRDNALWHWRRHEETVKRKGICVGLEMRQRWVASCCGSW